MNVIDVKNFTKDYGHHRGVFNATFAVKEGEVFGYLGPNGAGKTTTIRHMMGFAKPQHGSMEILSKDTWKETEDILQYVGYLPGEIALFDNFTAEQFLDYMANLRGVKDRTYMYELIKHFEFYPTGKIKRMSLGNKRKLAVITAFMHDPKILILDEPTSGLDPVMQNRFIDFIIQEKKRGKTIFLSSHIFKEVEAVCDRIAIIKDGDIVSIFDANALKNRPLKTFKIEFLTAEDYREFLNDTNFEILVTKDHYHQVRLSVKTNQLQDLFQSLLGKSVKYISEIQLTLQDYFMDFYNRNKTTKEGMSHVVYQNR